jgi:phosphate-selective porin OprO/OprP
VASQYRRAACAAGISACLAGLAAAPARAAADAETEAGTNADMLDAPVLEVTVPAVATAAAPAAPSRYAVPDLTGLTRYLPSLRTPIGTAAIGLELIGDWTGFRQDATSLAQVGQQFDQFQMRSAAIGISGQFGPDSHITYALGLQYNGFNTNADQNWTVSDFAINIDLPKYRTRIELGQIKGSFSYEVVGSFVKMPQAERTLSPFVAPRNPGFKIIHAIGPEKRMTATFSLYKDQAETAGGSLGGAFRLTGLVFGPGADGNGYLHVGGSVLLSGSDTAAVWRAQPGSDVADFYVDTGDLDVNRTANLGLEMLYSDGHGWSVQAEYVGAKVDTVAFGDIGFRGIYVLGSWVMTGEFRPYNRDSGVAGRIEPKGRWGAPEVYARWSMVDLDDGPVQGGKYDRLEIGFNWWATREWKFGLVAGRVWLDRFGETGVTDTLLTRLQWVY